MSFWRNVSPRRAWHDLREQLGTQQPHRLRFMALAAAVTASIFLLMFKQEAKGPPKPPEVIYFPSFLPRTDAEIIKENIAATEQRRRAEAEEEARQERIRQLYKSVGNATGIDTDKAYREGIAEREALKRAEQQRAEEVLKGRVTKSE